MNVTVLDQNDNSPEFVSSVTVLPVPENQQRNVPLYPVLALDADDGSYGSVTYELTQNDNQVFSIDVNNGQISLAVSVLVCLLYFKSVKLHLLITVE